MQLVVPFFSVLEAAAGVASDCPNFYFIFGSAYTIDREIEYFLVTYVS